MIARNLKLSLVLLAILLACPAVAKAEDGNKPGVYELGSFHVYPRSFTSLNLSCGRSNIAQSDEGYSAVDYDELRQNFPLPGYQTLKINMFTGGANCCFGYYLLSSSAQASVAAYIAPGDYNVVWESGRYVISDPYFMYYAPAFADNKIAFNRVQSPRPLRLLVFEQGKWRMDKPGEFPAFYQEQMALLPHRQPPHNQLAGEILRLYYALMSGQNEDECRAAFMRAPLAEYQKFHSQLFDEVSKSAKIFNPIQNLTCQ